ARNKQEAQAQSRRRRRSQRRSSRTGCRARPAPSSRPTDTDPIPCAKGAAANGKSPCRASAQQAGSRLSGSPSAALISSRSETARDSEAVLAAMEQEIPPRHLRARRPARARREGFVQVSPSSGGTREERGERRQEGPVDVEACLAAMTHKAGRPRFCFC